MSVPTREPEGGGAFAIDHEGFARDGVTCVRKAVGRAEQDMLRDEIEAVINGAGITLKEHSERNSRGGGRFVHAINLWQHRQRIDDFVRRSRIPELAASIMDADKVNLFFDQCFVKEPGTIDATPWHADQPYWPLRGRQVVTIWIALDPVATESGGLEFVAGSHGWGKWFQPRSFSGANELSRNEGFEEVPDVEAERDRYRIVSWDLEPGDALVFQGMILHGAPGNASTARRRRGYALRYTGDDVVYDPRPGCTPALIHDELTAGRPIDSDSYPVVWRRGA